MMKLTTPEERAQRIVNKHFTCPISEWKEYAVEEIRTALVELVESFRLYAASYEYDQDDPKYPGLKIGLGLLRMEVNAVLPDEEKIG